MWNIRKFNPTYRSGGLGKTDSTNKGFAKSVGKIFRFPSFNPVLKTLKLGTFLELSGKMLQITGPRYWTFGPLKYRPNKRSGKLKIKSQIVRVTIFCVKILLTRGGDSPLLILYISVIRHWVFLSWRQNYLFLEHFKRWLFIIMYYMQSIFHEVCLFFNLSRNWTHIDRWTIVELRIEKKHS